MAVFRLLDLPIVVLRRFVRRSLKSKFDVISFGLCNSKCYQLVKKAMLRTDDNKFIQVIQSDRYQMISARSLDLYYPIDRISDEEIEKDTNLEKVTIGNHSFWMSRYDWWSMHPSVYTKDITQTVGFLLNFIKNITNSPIIFHLVVMPNFQEYYLRNVVSQDVREVYIYGSSTGKTPIPGDIMEFILDETPSHCQLCFVSGPEPGFVYNKKLKKFAKFSMHIPDDMPIERIFVKGIDKA